MSLNEGPRGGAFKLHNSLDWVIGRVWVPGSHTPNEAPCRCILMHLDDVGVPAEHRRLIHVLCHHLHRCRVLEWTQVQEPVVQMDVGSLHFQGVYPLAFIVQWLVTRSTKLNQRDESMLSDYY